MVYEIILYVHFVSFCRLGIFHVGPSELCVLLEPQLALQLVFLERDQRNLSKMFDGVVVGYAL